MTHRHLFLLLALLASAAQAQVCDPRSSQSQITRETLQRASKEGDLPSALDYADRTRRNLDQLAAGAERCACPPARERFEAAAAIARRAADTDNRKDLRDTLAKAATAFDEGLAKLRECSRR